MKRQPDKPFLVLMFIMCILIILVITFSIIIAGLDERIAKLEQVKVQKNLMKDCSEIDVVYENGVISKCTSQDCMPAFLALYTNRSGIINWNCIV